MGRIEFLQILTELVSSTQIRRAEDIERDDGVWKDQSDLYNKAIQAIISEMEKLWSEEEIHNMVMNAKDCPNCNNQGWWAEQVEEDEFEQCQCQWCYTTEDSIFNLSKTIHTAYIAKLKELK